MNVTSEHAVGALQALAQKTRLETFRLLVRHEPDGIPAGEIARLAGVPQNTMSTHLRILSQAGLVSGERQSRSIVYRARLDVLRDLTLYLVRDCCGGSAGLCAPLVADLIPSASVRRPRMRNDHVYNVLFLCTGNSARSVMGEVLLNAMGNGRFRAFSAGSHPKGAVHPLTLRVLTDEGLPVEGVRSKSWDEFAQSGAPQMDFVFTVCDDAAGEACPLWPGHPVTAHWGIDDPARVEGSEMERLAAFVRALRFMKNRVAAFVALPVSSLDHLALQSKVRAIGEMDGSSTERAGAA